jgi:hypothetical protein
MSIYTWHRPILGYNFHTPLALSFIIRCWHSFPLEPETFTIKVIKYFLLLTKYIHQTPFSLSSVTDEPQQCQCTHSVLSCNIPHLTHLLTCKYFPLFSSKICLVSFVTVTNHMSRDELSSDITQLWKDRLQQVAQLLL